MGQDRKQYSFPLEEVGREEMCGRRSSEIFCCPTPILIYFVPLVHWWRVLREVSSEPALDLLQVIRWQIFNVLSGTFDGHGKNGSLLHLPDETVRLALFYDLVCTRAISADYSAADKHIPSVEHRRLPRCRYSNRIGQRYLYLFPGKRFNCAGNRRLR